MLQIANAHVSKFEERSYSTLMRSSKDVQERTMEQNGVLLSGARTDPTGRDEERISGAENYLTNGRVQSTS
jgi:hypothetical protein